MHRPDVLAVVPLKPFHTAKARLRGTLSDARVEQIARRMAAHVISTLAAAVPVAVVSHDDTVLGFGEHLGARPLREPPGNGGLNAALTAAATQATKEGVRTLLAVAADLPTLSVEDVEAMLRLPGRPGAVIAPDAAGTGTNAVAVSPPQALSFAFGNASFGAHRKAATRAGLRLRVMRRPGLARDVDLPGQLRWALDDAALAPFDPLAVALSEPDLPMGVAGGGEIPPPASAAGPAHTGTDGGGEPSEDADILPMPRFLDPGTVRRRPDAEPDPSGEQGPSGPSSGEQGP